MWIKAHCADCKSILGKEFKHVHEFLDQYAEVFDVGTFVEYHRSFLHNKAGLEVIRSRWGNEAYLAGVIHISRDYHELRMDDKDMDWILKNFGKALMYFHDLTNLEPNLNPPIVQSWGGESLCSIAFKNEGYDQYYRSLKEI